MAHTDAKRLKFTQAIFVGRGRNWILGSLALFGSFFSMSLPPPHSGPPTSGGNTRARRRQRALEKGRVATIQMQPAAVGSIF